jgi:heme/copper-type cytochrome/quinol oxidase subunit 3
MADSAASTPAAPTPASAEGKAALALEDEGYYHESALNAAWSGARLAIGGLAFLFGAFAFAYFYLRSLDSESSWKGVGYHHPNGWLGAIIMLLVLASAGVHYLGLQRIKAGHKRIWQVCGLIALVLGLGAIAAQICELLYLPFPPASSGFSSVFVGFYPVFIVILLCGMIWLEILLARSRYIPAISFVEQPPTYTETFAVQRFQASLSAFSTVWNFLALMALLFWLLFYALS